MTWLLTHIPMIAAAAEHANSTLAVAPAYAGWGEVCVKLVVASVLSGVLGYERQRKGRAAGLRTHILVCLGATLLMAISDLLAWEWAGADMPVWLDRGRIAAGIITGVGFLGGGAILHFGREQRGLTTAAMIWFVAALGVAIGAGFLLISVLATLIALIVVVGFESLERLMPSRGYFLLTVRLPHTDADLSAISKRICEATHCRVIAARMKYTSSEAETTLVFRVEAPTTDAFPALAEQIQTVMPSASRFTLELQN